MDIGVTGVIEEPRHKHACGKEKPQKSTPSPISPPEASGQLLAIHPGPRVELIRMSNCIEIVTGTRMLIGSRTPCALQGLCYFPRNHIVLILSLP